MRVAILGINSQIGEDRVNIVCQVMNAHFMTVCMCTLGHVSDVDIATHSHSYKGVKLGVHDVVPLID